MTVSPLTFENHVPTAGPTLLVVVGHGDFSTASTDFTESMTEFLQGWSGAEVPAELESTRLAARDMLRHGKFKPTGRGKPASEYLLRVATAGTFPRIFPLVDVCNWVSLKYMVPISIWDLGRAASDHFSFRLGAEGESYVFNNSGQTIDLQDLVVGCADDRPIVNPIKDSMATKITPETTGFAAATYLPPEGVPFADQIKAAWTERLGSLDPDAKLRVGVVRPQGKVEL